MHPPFGFALFYLRSVAAKVPYMDKITGIKTEPVTTAQIYWGAVPFVIIQVIMVALAMMFPQMIMRYKGEPSTAPVDRVESAIWRRLAGSGPAGTCPAWRRACPSRSECAGNSGPSPGSGHTGRSRPQPAAQDQLNQGGAARVAPRF